MKLFIGSTIFLSLILLSIAVQWLIIDNNIKKPMIDVQPWQRILPNASKKVLFAGDSTAVGRGSDSNLNTTAGYFGRDYPHVSVENHSQNGLRLEGLAQILEGLQGKHFDLAVLQIGGNDIMFFTPIQKISNDHKRVIERAKKIADHVIILHSGDIGKAKLFIWPFTWIYTDRSLKLRQIYASRQDERVGYVDIYQRNQGADLSSDYAIDHIHLNSKGYALWYGYIIDELSQHHWLP